MRPDGVLWRTIFGLSIKVGKYASKDASIDSLEQPVVQQTDRSLDQDCCSRLTYIRFRQPFVAVIGKII